MHKKRLRELLRMFLFELVIGSIGIVIILWLAMDSNITKVFITEVGIFRPEYTFTLMIVFVAFSMLLLTILLVQGRKKKLNSTQRMSAFAKTVISSKEIRKMSLTQTVAENTCLIQSAKVRLPMNIPSGNPRVIDFYFSYEEKLDI
jgi:hypothetical protein